MIARIFTKRKVRRGSSLVEPDEIFLDSTNLENFNRQQFEGRIEKPISKRTILFFGFFFFVFVLVFFVQLGYLQIKEGSTYYARSEDNTLGQSIIFADRGIIYDRNKIELAWNKKAEEVPTTLAPEERQIAINAFEIRSYKPAGFSHLLGYVSYPAKDKLGNYWQNEFIGKDGLEKQYNEIIKGENGSKITETDARGKVQSENIVNPPKRGNDLVTTVDARIQEELFVLIKNAAENFLFSGGSGIIMDITNGEVLTSTSFPEYNSEILSLGKDSATISNYLEDKRKVFLDRNISGLYTPGSIVKPFLALGALAEGIIDPYKQILSTGSISIPNPYFPDQKTIFKDWQVNGWTDMREAIAVSSDIYFYSIGGGFEDQKGLGIKNIEKYSKLFGIGESTGVDLPDEKGGVIPSPEWKLENFNGDIWRIGDTYHTAIGQYGFQVTPIEMARAGAAIANSGTLVRPHFVLGDKEKEEDTSRVDLPVEYFKIVQEGMRQTVTLGTALSLNVPYVEVAAKTGTAQLGLSKNRVNSWVMGFFPYENPRYAFTILMESGPTTNSVNASSVMRQLLDWMSLNTPEYFAQ
ncbi:MAG TPA: penicillin-binding transpeptidase domain-containing protein [Candidatus Paceibacterota bacterium]